MGCSDAQGRPFLVTSFESREGTFWAIDSQSGAMITAEDHGCLENGAQEHW